MRIAGRLAPRAVDGEPRPLKDAVAVGLQLARMIHAAKRGVTEDLIVKCLGDDFERDRMAAPGAALPGQQNTRPPNFNGHGKCHR